jgi:hypothetical protein
MPISPQRKKQYDRYNQLAKPLAARDLDGVPTIEVFKKQYKTTPQTIARVRTETVYTDWKEKLKRAQSRILGQDFKEFTLTTKGKLREYADQAPHILYGIMMNDEEKAPARISAAVEILDRDGRFAKVSRLMNVKEGADGAPMLPEDAAIEMLDALNEAKKNKVN